MPLFLLCESNRPGRFQLGRGRQRELPHFEDVLGGLGEGGESRRVYLPLGELRCIRLGCNRALFCFWYGPKANRSKGIGYIVPTLLIDRCTNIRVLVYDIYASRDAISRNTGVTFSWACVVCTLNGCRTL